MKLTLRNLGRLREATIDLSKDLIVLTGPNNTSKTYVAHALYGFAADIPMAISFATKNVLVHFAAEMPDAEGLLRINIAEFVERFLPQIQTEIVNRFRQRLADTLASSEEFIARTEVKLELSDEQIAKRKQSLIESEDETLLEERGMISRKAAGDAIWIFERVPSPSPSVGEEPTGAPRFLLRTFAAANIATGLVTHLLQMPWHTHALTAERAAIQLFSRELSLKRTELVDELLKLHSAPSANTGEVLEEMLAQRAQRYPRAIRDGLRIANDAARYKAASSPLAPLAEHLERGLLGGAIRINEEGEMSFHPNESETRLSLHLASSSVKSLAALSFFLRHIAVKDFFLIIDEPELNLHPDNQRRVARVLARIVRSGIKVLISTHSDYIIRELNNLIMLSSDKDGSVRQRLGYDEQETLTPEQVGAYLFDSERANHIEVKPTGIEVATIDKEINALNRVSQDIYFSLFDKPGA